MFDRLVTHIADLVIDRIVERRSDLQPTYVVNNSSVNAPPSMSEAAMRLANESIRRMSRM